MSNVRGKAKEFKPMTMDILNLNSIIKKMKIEEVTSERILSYKNSINDEGLFSYRIFGNPGTKERMNKMGFISLNCKVMMPYIFITLSRMSSKFLRLAQGNIHFKVSENKKNLVETDSDEEGGTGFSFIYDNFDLVIKELFKDTGTKTRSNNLKFLSRVTKEEIFVDKWLIIPAAYREINTMDLESKGIINYDEINDLYLSLLRKSKNLSTSKDFGLINDITTFKIQEAIVEIYNFLVNKKISKKTGLIQQAGLAKTINYSAGAVIANPKLMRVSYSEIDSTNIPFGYIGVPITILLDIFYPFILKRLKDTFQLDEGMKRSFTAIMQAKDINEYSIEKVEEFISKAINDKEFLFKNMGYIGKDGKHYDYELPDGNVYKIIDFLKNEIVDPVIENKFVSGTRYPVTNRGSLQFLKPICTTTDKVKVVNTEAGLKYELVMNDNYIMSVCPNVHSLGPWGGDLDGDTIVLIGVFSNEANERIREKAWFRTNPLTTTSESQTGMKNELLMGLFNLTEK